VDERRGKARIPAFKNNNRFLRRIVNVPFYPSNRDKSTPETG
jgi:hypothetical protein